MTYEISFIPTSPFSSRVALTEAPTPLCNQRAKGTKREKAAQGIERIKNAMGHKPGPTSVL